MNVGISIGTAAMSAILGRQIVTQAISDASGSIYNSISEIFYYTDYVDKVLYDLDIGNKIKIMEELCKEITPVLSEEKTQNSHLKHNSVNCCLEQLHDMIVRIREDLKQISLIIKAHKQKWFSSWRSIDVHSQLSSLKIHSILLDKRYILLMNTLNISSALNKNL